MNGEWWNTPVIPEVKRQKDCQFKASLGYRVRHCFKTTKVMTRPTKGTKVPRHK